MEGREYINFKKVTLASFYEALSECAYNFLDTIDTHGLSDCKAQDLAHSLRNVFRAGTKENEEFVNYHGRYVYNRLMEELEIGMELESEDEDYAD